MQIQAVIFDRDNTLMHFAPERVAALEQQIAAIAPSLPPEAALRHWLQWEGGWPRRAEDEPVFWQNFWARFAEHHELSLPITERLSQEIGALYYTVFAAYPDAMPSLHTLYRAGLRLAVLTNFELPSVDRTLTYAGLDASLFDVLISSGATGYWKPDTRAYEAALLALKLPAAACAFVDDLPENVAAARSIGMRGYLLDRAATATADTHVITSLSALPELLLSPFGSAGAQVCCAHRHYDPGS
ncbi:HAD family hydrolase [Candidatus Gracilibacteria bacterium]|nr:HAD family hydrolase [Candidatus Gracilibacteria bacterium]